MLGLGKHVRGQPVGTCGAVGHHQHFTGAGHHVDAHRALHQTLGRGHIDVAGTGDDVHGVDALGAVGQGADGPGTAHAVDLVDVQQVGRRQDVRVDGAVLAGRGAHGHAGHTGHQGGDGVHEHAGEQRGVAALATGHIQAHAVHGQHALAQDAAVRAGLEPGFFQLFLMEGTDVVGGLADLFAMFGRDGRGGPGDVLFADAQGRGKFGTVEAAGIIDQGLIALFTYIGEDLAHAALNAVAGVETAVEPLRGLDPFLLGLQVQNSANHGIYLRKKNATGGRVDARNCASDEYSEGVRQCRDFRAGAAARVSAP